MIQQRTVLCDKDVTVSLSASLSLWFRASQQPHAGMGSCASKSISQLIKFNIVKISFAPIDANLTPSFRLCHFLLVYANS